MENIGSLCTHCGRDTAMGNSNGLFVNRVPSETDTQIGWLCVDCQLVECDNCGTETIDYMFVTDSIVCESCFGDQL
tara:strand:+ start:46 stop:273 length:228 start_codon:yes stop_codon:yes gene_type:complete